MKDLDFRIDWLSFAIPLPAVPGEGGLDTFVFILNQLASFTDGTLFLMPFLGEFQAGAAHGFYKTRWNLPAEGISISWGTVNAHAHIEFTGIGCQWLRNEGLIDTVLEFFATRASRIDIACDIETSVTPSEFASTCSSNRFKSRSSITSPTGDTEYVGARSGERMARVYRYAPPHPRSQFLRIELELKGDTARDACTRISRDGLISYSLYANSQFMWKHPIWTPGSAREATTASRKHDRDGASTLRWINTVVVPSLIKADKEGLIDLKQWIDDNLITVE